MSHEDVVSKRLEIITLVDEGSRGALEYLVNSLIKEKVNEIADFVANGEYAWLMKYDGLPAKMQALAKAIKEGKF